MYKYAYVSDEPIRLAKQGTRKADIIRWLAELCLGWLYVFAAAGEKCTTANRKKFAGYHPEYQEKIFSACPVLSGKQPACDGCSWVDTLIFDCRGFTRWLLAQVGILLYGAGATTQWETASNWAAQGTIDKMPRGLVCCVFKRKEGKMSHTGMHLENGNIIHCSTTVKRDTLPGTPAWTHYAIPAGLYTDAELKAAGVDVKASANVPALRRGSEGAAVAALQNLLNQWGANLVKDGVFGKETEQAVKEYQVTHKLTADGIVGAKTRAILDPLGMIAEAWNNTAPKPGQGQQEEPAPTEQSEAELDKLDPAPGPQNSGEDMVTIPAEDFKTLRAAAAVLYAVMKKYEQGSGEQ